MGRQVNFYFGSEDEQAFREKIESARALIFKQRNLPTRKCHIYGDFDNCELLSTAYTQLCICFLEDRKSLKYQEIPEIGVYNVDVDRSLCLEYCRSGYRSSDNLMLSGRIWYQHKYWDKDDDGASVLLEKPEELQRLYNSLARWIRKCCTRLPNGNYIGPHAMELYKRGAKLSP